MKKLFFAALLATVAVGGAYAQYASVANGPATKNCTGTTTPFCGASTYIIGTSTVAPLSVQNSTQRSL